jgi:hypothetical protein
VIWLTQLSDVPILRFKLSRDNLDENGSDNQTLKWRPVAKS